MLRLDRGPVRYNQPRTIDERLAIARDFVAVSMDDSLSPY